MARQILFSPLIHSLITRSRICGLAKYFTGGRPMTKPVCIPSTNHGRPSRVNSSYLKTKQKKNNVLLIVKLKI